MSESLKNKGSQPDMKQKSLMGWFGKPGAKPSGPAAGSSSSTSNKQTNATPIKAKTSSTPKTPSSSSGATKTDETPFKKPLNVARKVNQAPALHTRTPSVSTVVDSPPSSDTVDVDMASSDMDNDLQSVASAKTPSKRKEVDQDSDDDMPMSRSQRTARNKKPRITIALSDEDEDEDEAASMKSATSRISRFRKSPTKPKGRSRSRASDDDDFIVNDDDEPSPGPSRSSSRASKRDSSPEFSDASDEDVVQVRKASKPKKATTSRPPPKPTASGGGGSSNTFLTAAEQRVQNNKNDKKEKEDPYEFLGDIRDKDGVRPGQPGYDPRTLFIPRKAWDTFTPFEKQFWEIKQNHFDTVLFFQKGKFLELYEDDARIGHQEFDLKLTQRVKMSMVGVPESSFNLWASKFLAKGYKVGRVDQAETALGAEMRLAATKKAGQPKKAPAEKIVRRELNKVYTMGTLVDGDLLTDEQVSHIVSIRETPLADGDSESRFGICILDCSTSNFDLSAFIDDVCRTRLETALRQARVKELVFKKGNLSVGTTRLLKSVLPSNCLWTSLHDKEGYDLPQTQTELRNMFAGDDSMAQDDTPAGLPEQIVQMYDDPDVMVALGGMIWYIRQLNIDKDIMSMKKISVYDPMGKGDSLVLDGQTLAHVEVLLNNEGTEDGSLLKLLGRCVTPFGKRLFRMWLCMPLRDASAINARLDAVQDLLDNPAFEVDFTDVTKGLPDLERVVSRIHSNNCKVKDFIKVLKAFERLSKGLINMANTSSSFNSPIIADLLRSAPDLLPNIKNVRSFYKYSEEDDELMPVAGKDEEYDTIMDEIHKLEQSLEDALEKMEQDVGTKLEYWHSATGTKEIYVVQVKATFKNIPKTWTKAGSTKAVTRWTVPALASTIRSLKEARENRNTAIKSFKHRVFAEFDTDRDVWLSSVQVLAHLDCLFSLAKSSAALGEPICRPEIVQDDAALIEFEELRHPAISASSSLKGDFIPNDIMLGGSRGRVILLTGPNMGGKSTAMRMTATGVIMAQLGMMVPASRARIAPVDNILTRMGAYDNMFSNASTFKVELDESCKILRQATPKSLVILDELGRGTSTYDGMAIAGAVLHELATHTLALGFFATHYGSLTDDFAHVPTVRNMHMSTLVDDEKSELVFLYKLVDGNASSSFGTHVARLAGVPEPVVKRAEAVSADFVRQFAERLAGRRKTAAARVPLSAQANFAYLLRLARGEQPMPDDEFRKREVLDGIMGSMRGLRIAN